MLERRVKMRDGIGVVGNGARLGLDAKIMEVVFGLVTACLGVD